MRNWRAPQPLYDYSYHPPIQPVNQYPPNSTYPQPPVYPAAGTPYEQLMKPPHPAPWAPHYPHGGPGGLQPVNGFIHYFQDKNGQVDIDKMLTTVGQMANTVQQVAPLFKGVGSFIKGIK
ncbi:YppG family protein [Sediminibacillus albus]|uniref:YppG-like protein n=1 Tax=Sediminibacillus albus TaxID=407036 RepID=A0A1G9AU87_9BACI|nr:YppG family protein [Sediminibacillus albus]SDK30851.1 YppG-like protein [Sediminibacillus albus]